MLLAPRIPNISALDFRHCHEKRCIDTFDARLLDAVIGALNLAISRCPLVAAICNAAHSWRVFSREEALEPHRCPPRPLDRRYSGSRGSTEVYFYPAEESASSKFRVRGFAHSHLGRGAGGNAKRILLMIYKFGGSHHLQNNHRHSVRVHGRRLAAHRASFWVTNLEALSRIPSGYLLSIVHLLQLFLVFIGVGVLAKGKCPSP